MSHEDVVQILRRQKSLVAKHVEHFTVGEVAAWLDGFTIGVRKSAPMGNMTAVLKDRGWGDVSWTCPSPGLIGEMEAKGLSKSAIIDELFEIFIAAYRRSTKD